MVNLEAKTHHFFVLQIFTCDEPEAAFMLKKTAYFLFGVIFLRNYGKELSGKM
jgi:hypothetical protein